MAQPLVVPFGARRQCGPGLTGLVGGYGMQGAVAARSLPTPAGGEDAMSGRISPATRNAASFAPQVIRARLRSHVSRQSGHPTTHRTGRRRTANRAPSGRRCATSSRSNEGRPSAGMESIPAVHAGADRSWLCALIRLMLCCIGFGGRQRFRQPTITASR
jgi:hypothetical protein